MENDDVQVIAGRNGKLLEGKEKEVIINYLNFLNEYEKYKEQLVEDEIDLGSIPKQFRKKELCGIEGNQNGFASGRLSE